MAPLLHDALVELLTNPLVSASVLDHPVVNVTLVSTRDSGDVCHAVCGERRGVYFEEDVVEAEPATARWTEEHWKATTASAYILEPDRHGYAIRSLFWDLRNGLPPAIDIEAPVSEVVTEEVAESGAAPPGQTLRMKGGEPLLGPAESLPRASCLTAPRSMPPARSTRARLWWRSCDQRKSFR